ncbi:MAG: glycosyltransferase [Patescibacteria group bacterium]
MKIALVHDWLDMLGGAERVLIELHKMFPEAPIYTLFAEEQFLKKYLPEARIITSGIQNLPFRRSALWAPAMCVAIELFDLSAYDIVISSSVFFSKGLVLRPRTKHICYCYSPTRQLWDRNIESRRGIFAAIGKNILRLWDSHSSGRVDYFVAISKHVQDRIRKYYRRDSKIIYPPATSFARKASTAPGEDYYLIISRLYPHKNLDIAIEAFNKLGYSLYIIGDGPLRNRLSKLADANIRFLGELNDDEVARYYQYAKAFIMPQEEDFGLTAVEAMSFGKPILALRKGGALEIVQEGISGEFFDDPIAEGLADGVRRLNEQTYDSEMIKTAAKKFSTDTFRTEIQNLIHETFSHHHQL